MRLVRDTILIFLCVSFGFCMALFGTITRGTPVTSSSTTTGKTLTPSVTAAHTGDTLVVYTFSNLNNRTVSSISWTGGAFSVLSGCTANDGTHDVEIWRAHNVTAGTNTMTITWSGNTAARSAVIVDYSGNAGSFTDGSCATAGTGTVSPATTGSITCTPNAAAQCGWLAVTGVAVSSDTITYSVPTTAGGSCSISATDSCQEGHEEDSVAHTQSGSATLGSGASWVMTMGAILEPAGPVVPIIHTAGDVSAQIANWSFGIVNARSRTHWKPLDIIGWTQTALNVFELRYLILAWRILNSAARLGVAALVRARARIYLPLSEFSN